MGRMGEAVGISVADADALVGEVLSPKTFYSVAAPRKTGIMPTVALAPASSAYPTGYHAGDGGGLPAIDADLAEANIKYGATIFGIAGGYGRNLLTTDYSRTTIYIHSMITSTVTTQYSTPWGAGLPYSLAWDGNRLISLDGFDTYNSVYVHESVTKTILLSFSTPATDASGLTYKSPNLITSDYIRDSIYIHSGITSTVTTSFSSPVANPYGLTIIGANLLSSDTGNVSVYIHSGITSTVTTSFSLPAGNPHDLGYDGANLISQSTSNNSIYIHTGVTSTITTSFSTPGTASHGLTIVS